MSVGRATTPWNLSLLVLAILMVSVPLVVRGDEPTTVPRVDLVLGRGLDIPNRAIVDPADAFDSAVGQVFCLARVVGAVAPTSVTFVWYHEGKTMARVDLPVRSADYRTWSSKNILPAWTGAWEIKVLDPKGQVLGQASFRINGGQAVAE